MAGWLPVNTCTYGFTVKLSLAWLGGVAQRHCSSPTSLALVARAVPGARMLPRSLEPCANAASRGARHRPCIIGDSDTRQQPVTLNGHSAFCTAFLHGCSLGCPMRERGGAVCRASHDDARSGPDAPPARHQRATSWLASHIDWQHVALHCTFCMDALRGARPRRCVGAAERVRVCACRDDAPARTHRRAPVCHFLAGQPH